MEMKRINHHMRIILNCILIAAMLIGFLGFPSATKAEDKVTAMDAGVLAGVAVGIGIIIGMVTRSENRAPLKSVSKGETDTSHFFQKKLDIQETPSPFQQLEFHITILNLRFE